MCQTETFRCWRTRPIRRCRPGQVSNGRPINDVSTALCTRFIIITRQRAFITNIYTRGPVYMESVCVCVSTIYFPFEKSQSSTSVTRNGRRCNNNRIVAEIIKIITIYIIAKRLFSALRLATALNERNGPKRARRSNKRRLFHDVFSTPFGSVQNGVGTQSFSSTPPYDHFDDKTSI